jgi:hypothetical protein
MFKAALMFSGSCLAASITRSQGLATFLTRGIGAKHFPS